MEKSKLQKNKCWEFSGNITKKGYGAFVHKGVTVSAHRISWLLFNGGGFTALNVLHKCDNRKCFNPEHLFLGTIQENNQDRDKKNRQSKGESHPKSKLSIEDVKEIKVLISKGTKISHIAKKYGVHFSTIYYIVNGITWKHV